MNKTYTFNTTGSYYLESKEYYYPITAGDSVILTAGEATAYADYITENNTWKRPMDEQEVTTTGGAQTFTKTISNASAGTTQKIVVVTATVVDTLPTGGYVTVEALNSSGATVETRSLELGTLTDTSATYSFSGSWLNEVASYKVSGSVPQASGSNYTITLEISETDVSTCGYVDITNNGMVSGANDLDIQMKDSDGDDLSDSKGIVKVMVASDPIGSLAPATLMDGIAVGTDGELIETADDQRFFLMSELDGDVDLSLTPTNAGTPTVSICTFGTAAPTTGDTVTFGTEVYEFTTDGTTPLTDPDNIRIDMTGDGGAFTAVTTHTTAAQAFKYVFNNNTSYDAVASGAAAAITVTAIKFFVDYNSLATTTSITATATGAWEDTTFGGGTGSSTTGVDPTSSWYLLFELDNGKRFVSEQLPYRM